MTGAPDVRRAVFAPLAVLVMGYPCALGMATPLAMIRGGGMVAERGILMRSAEAFQVLKDVRTVVLDKTGTITRGTPALRELVPLDGSDRRKLLALACSPRPPAARWSCRSSVGPAGNADALRAADRTGADPR